MSLLDTASLIVTPNGYKEGKLYSVIPSDGSGDMSVGRATTATRVNSAGLVELVPYNLVQYSEQFDNAWWLKFQANVTADNTTAPNGTTTADKVIASTNGAAVVYRSETYLVSGVYNFSIYAKSGNQDKVYLEAYGVGGTACSTNINLTTQTIISQTNFTNINIENVGNGWFRISATFSNLGGSVVTFGFGMATSVSTNDFAYFWGGQLVEGSTAKDYQKTETRLNIPRLDYSNGTCPSLLVEPQRTNLIRYSEQFDNAAWTKINSTITANTTTAPNGTLTAETWQGDGTANVHQLISSTSTFVLGFTYIYAIYVKKGTNNFIQFLAAGTIGGMFANFDLNTGVVGTLGTVTGSNPTSDITSLGDDWYRCSMTFTATSSQTTSISCILTSSSSSVRAESNSLSTNVFLWGAQLESGSYSTSYIPTTTASVTRNADVISKTGITSLIGQTEGTMFCDFWNYGNTLLASNVISSINAGDYGNGVWIEIYNGQLYGNVFESYAAQFQPNAGTISVGRHKAAIAYKANDLVFYVDGIQIATDTSATVPSCSRVDIGTVGTSTTPQELAVKAAALYKTRLTNAQLATLTTI